MTFKELVDKIESAVNGHGMLYDFGYGQLSDIKVLDEDGDGANYPYAFLTPAGITRNQQSTLYTFSLIIMEMAQTPSDVLKIQSDCIQYLNDIIATLRFDASFGGDLILNNSIQVFRERFQDEVAGATASFQVAIADPVNLCDAPVAQWTSFSPQTFNSTIPTYYNQFEGTPCGQTDMNVQQWKYQFNLDLTALESIEDWTWKYISIYSLDTESGAMTIIAREPLTISDAAPNEAINWTAEFEFECPLSDTTAAQLLWGIGDSRDTAVILNALQIEGTLIRSYKSVTL